MPWYQILSIVVSIVAGIFGIIGLSAYINERMKHKASKKNLKEDKLEEKKLEDAAKLRDLEHEQYKKELTQIINAAIQPLASDIALIKTDLAKNTEGTVTLLRTDMKNSVDSFKDKGYASAGDRANWIELYNTYDRLGGNHFKEYVDGWKEEMYALPFKKETVRKSAKKKVLLEKK